MGRAGVASAGEVVRELWSRADRSGPLPAGNVFEAGRAVNAWTKAAGTDRIVKTQVLESPATGHAAGALELREACTVDRCPDFYVPTHEWLGEFAKSGYAMQLDDFVERHPWTLEDTIPMLCDSVKYQGKI